MKNAENIVCSNNKFVVVNIKTSHFHPEKGAMIIELAAIKIKNNKIIDKRTQLINPERKITKRITELTGITNEMLDNKPKFRQVLPRFYDFLGDSVVVGHNVKFDWDRFLVYFLKKVGIYPNNHTVDTLKLSKKYIKSDRYRLMDVCNACGIKFKNAHRALNDALATTKLFLHLKNNIKNNDIQIKNNNQTVIHEFKNLKTQYKKQDIRNISYWQKKQFKRIYVTLDRSVVFFDIPTKAWEVKSSNEPINFKKVEKDVLSFLSLNNIEELVKKYA